MPRFAIRLFLCLLLATTAGAATHTVTTTADIDDGSCDAVNCPLREAINAANAGGGGSIAFAAGFGAVTINLATPLPS